MKALVRETGIPLDLTHKEYDGTIREKLEESLAVAKDPDAKRYTHEEIFAPLRKKFGYDIQT